MLFGIATTEIDADKTVAFMLRRTMQEEGQKVIIIAMKMSEEVPCCSRPLRRKRICGNMLIEQGTACSRGANGASIFYDPIRDT